MEYTPKWFFQRLIPWTTGRRRRRSTTNHRMCSDRKLNIQLTDRLKGSSSTSVQFSVGQRTRPYRRADDRHDDKQERWAETETINIIYYSPSHLKHGCVFSVFSRAAGPTHSQSFNIRHTPTISSSSPQPATTTWTNGVNHKMRSFRGNIMVGHQHHPEDQERVRQS